VSRKVAQPPSDRVISGLAAAQHGVVGRRQLLVLEVPLHDVEHRVRLGRLHGVHRGVYSLAPPSTLTLQGHWMAAVLVCGPGAVLSHATAGAHWDLRQSAASVIDVTVPSRTGRLRRPGIRLHRSATLTPEQCTVHRGIPVTTVARTLIDLADRYDHQTAKRATEQAEVLGLFDLTALEEVIAANNGHKGAIAIRRVLEDYTVGAGLTESDLEDEFLRMCDRFGILRPEVQPWIGTDRPDFLWREIGLVVETDSWRWHGGRERWEADQRKALRLQQRGLTVTRVSYRRVFLEPGEVAADLKLIGAPSAVPHPT
jgi:very-short-patch-repair endonuclease